MMPTTGPGTSSTNGRQNLLTNETTPPIRRILVRFAPVMPDQLEAEEMEQLAEEMRIAVADLPRDVGVRSFMLVGNPRRKVAELLAAGDYDLVV